MRIFVVLTIQLFMSVLVGQARPQESGSVSGVVVSLTRSEPLSGVTLNLRAVGSVSRPYTAQQVTGPDGRFQFDGLDPDEYELIARKEGHVDTALGQRGFVRVVASGARTAADGVPSGPATPFLLAAGQKKTD